MATLQELVAQVATAYFTNVSVSVADIPAAMSAITDALRAAEDLAAQQPATGVDAAPSAASPRVREAAEIRRSITPDALISFEDGRPYKTLRRHLTARGLTPVEYRAKHGLPDDYPMVAQNTSAARSQLARDIGLGGKRPASPRPTTPAPEAVANGAASSNAKASRRGRAAKPAAARRPPRP